MVDEEISKELDELKKERLETEQLVKSEQLKFKNMLDYGLRDEINDVLDGKKVFKLTLGEKIKYKTKRYLDIIFEKFYRKQQ